MHSSLQPQPQLLWQHAPGRRGPSLDADVRFAALASLGRYGHPALNAVCCDVHRGHVTLQGRVPTYHLKQLAQECVQRVAGVRRVVNELAVGRAVDRGRPS